MQRDRSTPWCDGVELTSHTSASQFTRIICCCEGEDHTTYSVILHPVVREREQTDRLNEGDRHTNREQNIQEVRLSRTPRSRKERNRHRQTAREREREREIERESKGQKERPHSRQQDTHHALCQAHHYICPLISSNTDTHPFHNTNVRIHNTTTAMKSEHAYMHT